ncbi:nucleotide exchange factor GrpE [Granulosicoccaceae sp. 1_MG-2023]|nr:nucleotide exchange factor GrpE [Granulosicoccaceae sp. 1_MG-2023]
MTQKDDVQYDAEEPSVVDEQATGEESGNAAEADAANAESAEIAALREALEKAEAKAAENWDRCVRMQAEMENTRKRLQQEVDNARKFGQKNLIEELLPIIDSMEMGVNAANEDGVEISKIREGYELTNKMLAQLLAKFNVAAVDPAGEKFDPDKHQAMSMQEGTGAEPNTVVAVMQKGYTLNERLIRPALVMVAK